MAVVVPVDQSPCRQAIRRQLVAMLLFCLVLATSELDLLPSEAEPQGLERAVMCLFRQEAPRDKAVLSLS